LAQNIDRLRGITSTCGGNSGRVRLPRDNPWAGGIVAVSPALVYPIKDSDNRLNRAIMMMIYIPNLLTLGRIALVPILILLLQEMNYLWSLMVFLIAGISDGLDGYIAKRFDARTQLGAILDPLADKALIISAYVTLSTLALVPFWLVVAVVFRDVIIVCGYLIMALFFGSPEMQPLKVSKVNTFFQLAYVFVVLAALAGADLLSIIISPLAFIVLITSVVSGGAYVVIWSMRATRSPEDIVAK
jgi:cardiolipin synthase